MNKDLIALQQESIAETHEIIRKRVLNEFKEGQLPGWDTLEIELKVEDTPMLRPGGGISRAAINWGSSLVVLHDCGYPPSSGSGLRLIEEEGLDEALEWWAKEIERKKVQVYKDKK